MNAKFDRAIRFSGQDNPTNDSRAYPGFEESKDLGADVGGAPVTEEEKKAAEEED